MGQRHRVRFAILEPMRFTGHLDLQRTWERAIRRAGLPLAYSQGFHAHPRIQIGAALPLGCTATAELLDLWLEEDLGEAEAGAMLESSLPPGLRLISLSLLDAGHRGLQEEIVAADYTATPLEGTFPPHLAEGVAGLLGRPTILRERRGRSYDLRPLVLELQILPLGRPESLHMRLCLGERATGRPDEVLATLDLGDLAVHVNRDRLLLRDEAGDLIPSDR